MKVELWIRRPGQHTLASSVEFECVPRVGEMVVLDGMYREVHSVEYHLNGYGLHHQGVRVLLKD